MNADKIAVINKGSIVELGRHEELLAMNNVYADLIRLQVTGSNDESHNLAVHDRQLTDALHEESKLTDGEENVAAIVDKVNLVDTLSSPAKVEEEKELDKDEKKSLSREVRALIHRQQHWFLLSVVGAAVFGSIFPGITITF
jgi:ABC-type multidrug transport system ATPase subunit